MKNTSFDNLGFYDQISMSPTTMLEPFEINLKDFMQEEFHIINNIIAMLSKGVFSPALVSTIVKSSLIYQYMQADVLNVLQRNFDQELAQQFIEKTKTSIKFIVETLQKNRMI